MHPVTKVDERHYFQFGGLGGTSINEHRNGGGPAPTTEMPESEWGGIEGMGLASGKYLRSILFEAIDRGEFIGAKPGKYPWDYGIYVRFEIDLSCSLFTLKKFPTLCYNCFHSSGNINMVICQPLRHEI